MSTDDARARRRPNSIANPIRDVHLGPHREDLATWFGRRGRLLAETERPSRFMTSAGTVMEVEVAIGVHGVFPLSLGIERGDRHE